MIVFAPIVEFPGDKFRSVIHPNHLRQSATFFELIQYTDHAQRRQAGVGFDPEYLAVVVNHLPFYLRTYSFFSTASFKAWCPNLWSAYIRVIRACSASCALIGANSLTLTPP